MKISNYQKIWVKISLTHFFLEIPKRTTDKNCRPSSDTQIMFVLRFYSPVNPMGSCRVLPVYLYHSGLTIFWANSADDKLMIFFPEHKFWQFMQTASNGHNWHEMFVSNGDNLHEISKSVFWENKKNILNYSKTCIKRPP